MFNPQNIQKKKKFESTKKLSKNNITPKIKKRTKSQHVNINIFTIIISALKFKQ